MTNRLEVHNLLFSVIHDHYVTTRKSMQSNKLLSNFLITTNENGINTFTCLLWWDHKTSEKCENISLHGVKAHTANSISFKQPCFATLIKVIDNVRMTDPKITVKINKTIIHLWPFFPPLLIMSCCICAWTTGTNARKHFGSVFPRVRHYSRNNKPELETWPVN